MKKLLDRGSGLLLSGCVNETTNDSIFSKKGKERKEKIKKYPYGAYWFLQKKGFNRQGFEYGFTRSEAKKNAWEACEIKRKKVGKGICKVGSSCTSRGRECDSAIARQKKREQKLKAANKSSSGSKIDPSVWDDLNSISQGILRDGKSASEALSGSSSPRRTMTCFKTGEETGGLNKICRYDCVGNLVTTTVGSAQICPVQIQR